MAKTYLFDFDGTLVDSMPTYGKMILKIVNEYGVDYPEDIIKITTPLGFLGTARYYIGLGISETEEFLVQKMKNMLVKEYENNIPAKSNVIEVLKQLKARGDSLNVLTASPHESLDPCLKRLGIYDLFDNVWSCDDFNTTKADPEIYKMASKRIGVDVQDVIFLDDNLNADKTAKTAGMIVYGVYDPSSKDFVDEMKAITDKYIYDFKELL
ncbi:MAG: HAD family phosphatase [Clostridiales bacterium]|nr:HAD family phosphatase [Clostridiales bacterium]